MQTKLFQVSSWLLIHRTQLQVVFFLVLLSLVMAALVLPGTLALADGGPVIGGH